MSGNYRVRVCNGLSLTLQCIGGRGTCLNLCHCLCVIWRYLENVALKGSRSGQAEPAPDSNANVRLVIPGLEALNENLSETFNVSECVAGLSHNLKKDLSLYESKAAGFRLKMANDTVPNNQGEKVLNIPDPLEFWIGQVMYLFIITHAVRNFIFVFRNRQKTSSLPCRSWLRISWLCPARVSLVKGVCV